MMPSKTLKAKRAAVARLRRAADRIVPELAPGLTERLDPSREQGENLGGVALVATLAVERVESRLDRLESAEAVHDVARVALAGARWEKNIATLRLRDTLSPIHKLDRSLYPGDRRKQLPKQPNALLRHMVWLQRPRPPGRAPSPPGFDVDFDAATAAARPAADALRAALEDVEEKVTEAKLTKEAKDRALARFNADYGPCLRFLEAFAALAGRPELAEELRAKRRAAT